MNERYSLIGRKITMIEEYKKREITIKALKEYILKFLSSDVACEKINAETICLASQNLLKEIEKLRILSNRITIIEKELGA